MKRPIELRTNWYEDVLPYPMPVCVITSQDHDGRPNLGAYSLVFPWSSPRSKPQIVVQCRHTSGTLKNIQKTGEFVLNYVPQAFLKDVLAVGRNHPDEVDKLALTRFTLAPSEKVEVPRLQEAIFCVECILDQIIYPTPHQGNLIATMVHAVMEEDLLEMDKRERLSQADLAIFFGYESGHYFFCPTGEPLSLPIRPDLEAEKDKAPLSWEAEAEALLREVPSLFRKNVRRAIEKQLRQEGKEHVTAEDMRRLRRQME
ncbi:MAG: flavin reductase [Chloroflexia bacterium]|nr:flavin reductase [Chloroflexia bacterium]